MKKTFIPLALAAALFTTGCKDSENIIDTPSTPDLSDHEAISFTMSDEQGAQTRAMTRAGFTSDTRILMRIQSDATGKSTLATRCIATASVQATSADYSKVSFDGDTRYWDDCYGRAANLSVFAVAIPNSVNTDLLPLNKLKDGAGAENGDTNTSWGSTDADKHEIAWSVATNQSGSTVLADEDLVYSNNIKNGGTDGVYTYDFTNNKYTPDEGTGTHTNGQMKFQLQDTSIPDGPGKFNKGHLKFNHSLSRITVELVKGSGFASGDPFKFEGGTQIQLNKMNISGTLAINTGTWTPASTSSTSATGNITKMQPAAEYSNAAGTYSAQMLPDYVISSTGNTTNMLQFTIDDQTYFITQAMVFEALTKAGSWFTNSSTTDADKLAAGFDDATNPTKVTMAQGKNYKLKITVNKTQISAVTATIAAWSDITAENQNIDNAHFTITDIYDNGTKETSGVHLFRIPEVLDDILTSGGIPEGKGIAYQGKYYDDEATMTAHASGSNVWSTNWYFNDNKTLYHIRSLNDLACKGKTTSADHKTNLVNDGNNTYFTMINGAQASSDYHWGAPMQADGSGTSTKFQYDETYGFKAHLHKGLPAMTNTAEKPINITELHMMSNINVVVRTPGTVSSGTVTYGANGVKLVDDTQQTVVTITRLYNKAKVDMGIGLVTVDNSETNSETGLDQITAGVKAGETMTAPDNTLEQKTGSDSKTYIATKPFTFAVVPQSLKRGSATDKTEDYYVGITIKTPDNNEYYVIKKLCEILPTNVGTSQNQTTDKAITCWYPNHSYTYTFTITKKGIEAITCTVANWVDITAADTPIDLES